MNSVRYSVDWLKRTEDTLNANSYLGISLFDWGLVLLATAVLFSVLSFAKSRLSNKLCALAKTSAAHWDDILARCLSRTHGVFLFVLSLYIASGLVGASGRGEAIIGKMFVIASFFQLALWGNEILAYGLSRYLAKRYGHSDATLDNLSTYSVIDITAKFVLWTVLFLLLLDNLGVNITALVTGLGIGGIAIALAVQNILGDIFASLTIVMDRPFEVGDFIVVDDKSGTVEAIGLKTSRIRSLSGEQLVFPNKKLIEDSIQNFKRMAERRVVFSFKLDYETPSAVLQKIPSLVADIIKAKPEVRFDRAHLSKLGDMALEFEAVYIVLSTDYNKHMDIQQAIFIEVIEAVRKLKASFSYPTPSVQIDSANLVDSRRVLGRELEEAAH